MPHVLERAGASELRRVELSVVVKTLLTSDVADIGNMADAPMAGAVTAALFLQKFVPAGTPWAHLDTFAWRSSAKPGRPKGGDAVGLRAVWEMLKSRHEK